MLQKKAIALLITVFFIMAITISIGVALKYVKSASKSINSEQSMLQSSIILNDVLMMLKSSAAIEQINSSEGLALFLNQSSFIPFQSSGVTVLIEMSSARAKVNPNTLSNKDKLDAFKNFLMAKMVNIEYADMLYDVIGGIKVDMSYNTDIFTQKRNLFRDYLASYKHLQEINDTYMKKYHDNSLKNVDFENLFYINKEINFKVDLNYATPSAWQLMLGCNEERASALSDNSGEYTTLEDLLLSDEEKVALQRFQYSFFEPYIDVKIEIMQKDISINIRFEYNIKQKKGSNFVYEV
ncbi:MAG: hypothetical protein AUK54_04375 [Helicobacteraceae bacterium CG2_30_36_10]|nr:MAG: hypothetical protein AUK54_04375 [Helicobacteraceae bacterium CG2_30_36_10]